MNKTQPKEFPVRVSLTKGPRLTIFAYSNYDDINGIYSVRILPPDASVGHFRIALVETKLGRVFNAREQSKALYEQVDAHEIGKSLPNYFNIVDATAVVHEKGIMVNLPKELPTYRAHKPRTPRKALIAHAELSEARLAGTPKAEDSEDRIKAVLAEANLCLKEIEGLAWAIDDAGDLRAKIIIQKTF